MNPSEIPGDVVPRWPLYRLTAGPDGAVVITGPAAPAHPLADRAASVEAVAALAAVLTPPRPVRAEAHDADGTVWPLLIHPDGTVSEHGSAQHPPKRRRKKTRKGKSNHTTPATLAPSAVPLPDPASAAPPSPAAPVLHTAPDPLDFPLEPAPEAAAAPRVPASTETADVLRVRRPRPVAEQHERPAEDAVPSPAPSMAAPSIPRPAEPAVPAPSPAAAEPRNEPIPSTLRIRTLAEAGRLPEALQMAAAYDDAAARTHGPSHPTAIEAREIRAHISVEYGDLTAGIALYRDAAERWALRSQTAAADAAAGRAHALWMRITDPQEAVAVGETIVRMRTQIPGPDGTAYRSAARRLNELKKPAAH
ncbi:MULTISPECIES: hypothetical protein [unclassified Streptomyces]|uniref:hypothetical protein n=1 Tax=unclassified Streptomyces TaxID=2593676 RepID=UPI0033FCE6A0